MEKRKILAELKALEADLASSQAELDDCREEEKAIDEQIAKLGLRLRELRARQSSLAGSSHTYGSISRIRGKIKVFNNMLEDVDKPAVIFKVPPSQYSDKRDSVFVKATPKRFYFRPRGNPTCQYWTDKEGLVKGYGGIVIDLQTSVPGYDKP